MGKGFKNNRKKVPKITEEEYAAYISALKAADGGALQKNAEKGNNLDKI